MALYVVSFEFSCKLSAVTASNTTITVRGGAEDDFDRW